MSCNKAFSYLNSYGKDVNIADWERIFIDERDLEGKHGSVTLGRRFAVLPFAKGLSKESPTAAAYIKAQRKPSLFNSIVDFFRKICSRISQFFSTFCD